MTSHYQSVYIVIFKYISLTLHQQFKLSTNIKTFFHIENIENIVIHIVK